MSKRYQRLDLFASIMTLAFVVSFAAQYATGGDYYPSLILAVLFWLMSEVYALRARLEIWEAGR